MSALDWVTDVDVSILKKSPLNATAVMGSSLQHVEHIIAISSCKVKCFNCCVTQYIVDYTYEIFQSLNCVSAQHLFLQYFFRFIMYSNYFVSLS